MNFFAIFVNGSHSYTFKASIEIRPGDPLSPFLFIIIAEGLGRYFKRSPEEGALQGLHITLSYEPLSHLQLMDDTLLMGGPHLGKKGP